MNIHNWKIFDKKGDPLNWTPFSLINLSFEGSPVGTDAEGFLVTDTSGYVVDTVLTNGGYLYDGDTVVSYSYSSDEGRREIPDAIITYEDVSIFDPEPRNTKSIKNIDVDISTQFVYPSTTYAAAVFLEPISVGLIETEHLFILEEFQDKLIRPYDEENNILLFEFLGDDVELQFFEVDENSQEVTWGDTLVFDVSILSANVPLQINIGFKAEVEGVFERTIRIYHLVGDTLYMLADIVVNAESIDQDERFRSLLTNFGLPDPITIPKIFKETDINEDLPDWELINYKSKHMILEYNKIMPYVGTYKGLINAIKWLGYDDIYIREWFKNVKENKKISFVVPYDAKDRTQTILTFNEDERKVLKKLNQLSLVYCLTRETGAIDVWGTPETENCYSYNIKELFVKLLGLKKWLEQNIIGVNARIIDITGEGIYYERIQNIVYATDNVGFEYAIQQSLSPYGVDGNSELVTGDASIRLSFLELTQTTVNDIPIEFKDFVDYVWDPQNPDIHLSVDDPSYLENPENYLLVGNSLQYPLLYIKDIMYRLSTEKEFSGILGETFVTNPLHILENDIRFVDMFDTSTVFHDVSTSLTLYLEEAYLRDADNDNWNESIAYSIYPNPSANGYTMESSVGNIIEFSDYPSFSPATGSLIQYAVDDNYRVPLISFENYKYTDVNNDTHIISKKYFLDIVDGKIEMNGGVMNPVNSSDNATVYLNFNYDTSLDEQKITLNVVYSSPRITITQIDPSAYYWADPSGKTGGNNPNIYLYDNSIYNMYVNHTGDYNIELFGWDDFNTLFYNPAKTKYPVWIKSPTLYTLIDNSCNNVCVSTYMTVEEVSTLISENLYPDYDRVIPLQGLSFEIDENGKPYISVPSITYWQDVPTPNSFNCFYNLTERVLTISGTDITIDDDFQKFYTGDNVRLIRFDKGKYELLEEVSANIISASGSEPVTAKLDQLPSSFVIEASTDIFILNDTYRETSNAKNVEEHLVLDVDGYAFEVGQLVGVIITDTNKPDYEWGASYRVLEVDGFTHTLEYTVPDFLLDVTTGYNIRVKHAYSSYTDLVMKTESAVEFNNVFKIYNKDTYCQEYYLDNTFILINVLFDQDKVNEQWYDPSDNLIHNEFYYYPEPINVDVSTLVILRALYDPSNYMLDQRNIWEVTNNDTGLLLFRVWNESVPYIFDEEGTYDVQCTSYDSYGNAITKKYEGLIKVV